MIQNAKTVRPICSLLEEHEAAAPLCDCNSDTKSVNMRDDGDHHHVPSRPGEVPELCKDPGEQVILLLYYYYIARA